MSKDKIPFDSLVKKLNDELEDFINSREKKPYQDGWSEDNWEKEMQMHPLFMTESVSDDSELPPLVEALQQLKYDPAENTSEELANNYKEDGNENFKMKKYRWAIDSYSAGLKQKSTNAELNAILYTNRAAAHFYLGNFRSALKDCEQALKQTPNHKKALLRGAQCCKELKRFPESINWIEKILKIDAHNTKCKELIDECHNLQKVHERDQRKKFAEERKKGTQECLLNCALRERNVKFYARDKDVDDTTEFDILASTHPAVGNFKVYSSENGQLIWPVIFLYPEHGQTDFIQEFTEVNTFKDHLDIMFDPSNKPEWDIEGKYHPSDIEIYFEDYETKELVCIASNVTLKEAISHEQFQVSSGNPIFLLLARGTDYAKKFKEKHEILK